MKLFSCSACKHVAFFENSQCVSCGHQLAYLSDRGALSALEPANGGPAGIAGVTSQGGAALFVALDQSANGARYRLCRNYTSHAVCNWAIPEHDPNELCLACRLNETLPDPTDPAGLQSWQQLEIAKHRLVYTLVALGLPIETRQERPGTGLAFAFMSDRQAGEKVLTGHCDGLVTINLAEADAPAREQTRVRLGERYRTLLGHFRHESGHYYWDRLVRDSTWLSEFRALFGDEQQDYAEAVKRHYAAPRQDWPSEFVSSYATMHPWEDWAETWAHYLHMIDTLETAQSYGLALRPQALGGAVTEAMSAGRVRLHDFEDLVAAWVPLTVALNSLNRSMGLEDAYPFVLAARVLDKLRFTHRVVESCSTGEAREQARPQRSGSARAPASGVVNPA